MDTLTRVAEWRWLPLTPVFVLLYLVFIGNTKLKIHGITESIWAGAQAMARIADRLGSIEGKLDRVIEASQTPDDSIRISIPK
jgi:hypothetical protein